MVLITLPDALLELEIRINWLKQVRNILPLYSFYRFTIASQLCEYVTEIEC